MNNFTLKKGDYIHTKTDEWLLVSDINERGYGEVICTYVDEFYHNNWITGTTKTYMIYDKYDDWKLQTSWTIGKHLNYKETLKIISSRFNSIIGLHSEFELISIGRENESFGKYYFTKDENNEIKLIKKEDE